LLLYSSHLPLGVPNELVIYHASRTTPNRSVGFTPFFLVYGAEVVMPTDIEFDAPRVV
jgi:hypothetical protein